MEILCFADDMAILLSDQTVDSLFNEVNKILNTIYDWFYNNKLKLSLLESKCMCFERCNFNDFHKNNLIVHSLKFNITSNNTCNLICIQLENVKKLKCFGLILDFRLKWNSHVNYLNNILRS